MSHFIKSWIFGSFIIILIFLPLISEASLIKESFSKTVLGAKKAYLLIDDIFSKITLFKQSKAPINTAGEFSSNTLHYSSVSPQDYPVLAQGNIVKATNDFSTEESQEETLLTAVNKSDIFTLIEEFMDLNNLVASTPTLLQPVVNNYNTYINRRGSADGLAASVGRETADIQDNIDSIEANNSLEENVLSVDTVNNRVGVGTTSPAYLLDVDGTARINNGLTLLGNATTTGLFINTSFNGASSASWLRHDPTAQGTIGTDSGNVGGFVFGADYQPTRFTNGPSGQENYTDDVWRFGSNIGSLSNHKASTTLASLGLTWESKFTQNSSSPFGSEFHLEGVANDDVTTYRPLSFFVAHDASEIGGTVTADHFNIRSKSGSATSTVQFNFTSGNNSIDLASTTINFDSNNTAFLKMRNAADSAFLNLPYIDNADVLIMSQPIYAAGGTAGSGAVFEGSFAVLQATAADNGDEILQLVGPSVTGSLAASQSGASASGDFFHHLINNNTTSGTANAMEKFVTGGANAGDPYTNYDINGIMNWSIGIDNSDSDSFKISRDDDLGTNDAFTITTSNNVGIGTTSPWKKLAVTGTVGFDGLTGSVGAGSLCLTADTEVVYNSGSDACLSSLRETKHNIQNLSLEGITTIEQLDSVSFIYNQGDGRTRYGFIAEDISLIDENLTTHDTEGNISGIDDRAVLSVVVKGIKEMWLKIKPITTWFNGDDLQVQGNICVEETCVTKDQFKQILLNATVGATQYINESTQNKEEIIDQENNEATITTEIIEEKTVTTTPEIMKEFTEEGVIIEEEIEKHKLNEELVAEEIKSESSN